MNPIRHVLEIADNYDDWFFKAAFYLYIISFLFLFSILYGIFYQPLILHYVFMVPADYKFDYDPNWSWYYKYFRFVFLPSNYTSMVDWFQHGTPNKLMFLCWPLIFSAIYTVLYFIIAGFMYGLIWQECVAPSVGAMFRPIISEAFKDFLPKK